MPSCSENGVSLSVPDDVFFNQKMEFCRDFCSLAISAIGENLDVCDSFCASGIRGIRYKKENKNVGNVFFVDRSRKAIACTRKNCKGNGIPSCSFFSDDISKFLLDPSHKFNFLEIDPFGSPAPFIFDACRKFSQEKKSYLSITATDTAVLCGAEHKACVRNYLASPLHNKLCHEVGARILAGFVQRNAASWGLSASPLLILSDQHYFKIIFELEADAKKAYESVNSQGYILFDEKTLGWREMQKPFLDKRGKYEVVAGPLYLGKLHSRELLKRMESGNKKCKYAQKEKLGKTLSLMLLENSFPPLYYDLHMLADRYKFSPAGMGQAIEKLGKEGFGACRTHFRPTAIKTDAGLEEVLKAARQ